MPSTLFALAVLVILVLPGAVFAVQTDKRLPTRELSPLRELSVIAGVGVLCDSIILLIFGVIRAAFPKITPDVGSIERLGMAYVKLHFVSIGWWAICLFLASCGLAYAFGKFSSKTARDEDPERITFESQWWRLFHNIYPEAYRYVGCHLQDDSYISGYLVGYSVNADETPDREISLGAPISYRPSAANQATELKDVAAVTVSARQLKFLTVTYTYFHPATMITHQGTDDE